MAAKSMSMATTKDDAGMAQIGDGAYTWKVSPTHVDLSMPPATPVLATIAAEPQTITIDLKRSAMIVVDMQNDFCAPGGWSIGLVPTSVRNARRSSRCSACFPHFARPAFRSFG